MEAIGKIIQRRRKSYDITQQELADLSCVGINTVVGVEKGTANPSLSTLMKILDVLGLEIVIRSKTAYPVGDDERF